MAAGDIFIWLSGASRQVLDQCPTERPKFIGLGASILVTAGMAAVSLAFALYTALKAPIWIAVIFALLWGLAIMSLDRLFVVSLHRYRNRFFYLLLAAPRFVMAVLLGFVISTPFVLQIFQPEIQHQIKLMQAAERAAYFQNLPHNPVYLDVQRDQTEVTSLTDEVATGGAAINPATDPTIVGWRSQLATAQNNEQTWFANLQCQLYGTALPGGRQCIQGNGPLAKDDQEQYDYWKGQVATLQAEIQQRTGTLEGQSAAQQQATQRQAKAQLAAAKLALGSAQAQLTLQTNGITQNINADTGLLTQLKALGNATAGDATLGWARLLLFLVFLCIDSMPVFVKLLLNLAPESSYDKLLAAEERQQQRLAEHTRAVRQAAQRKAAQAEAAGARDRLAALSAELPGMREEITSARLQVEQEWLRRWQADQMRRIGAGQGITPVDTGVGPMPSSDSWQWSPTDRGLDLRRTRGPGDARSQRLRRPRPGARDLAPQRTADQGLWGWLGSLRLPWRRRDEEVAAGPQRRPAPPAERPQPRRAANPQASNVTLVDTMPFGAPAEADTVTQPGWQYANGANGYDVNGADGYARDGY